MTETPVVLDFPAIARALASARPAGAGAKANASAGGAGAPSSPSRRTGGVDDFDVGDINEEYAVVLFGQRTMVMRERPPAASKERFQLLTIEGFEAWLANQRVRRVVGRREEDVAVSKLWLRHPERRQYEGIVFEPDPARDLTPPGYYNLWRGFDVAPSSEGDCSLFLDHMLENVCGGSVDLYNFVFGWFAHMVQRPRERLGTALVLRGGMGTGKTIVGKTIGSLFSSHYFLVDDPRYLTGQFNAHLAACLLLQADEGFWAGDKNAEGRLKGLVTSDVQMIEHKGVDPIRVNNFVRLLVTSNEDWVIPAGKDERRFAVVDVANKRACDHAYFGAIEAQLAHGGREALLKQLLTFKLDGLNLRDIPATAGLYEQKVRSLDPIESFWLERLREGAQLPGGAWEEWVATQDLVRAYTSAADRIGVRRKADETSLSMKLGKLVPGLRSDRRTLVTDAVAGIRERQRGYRFPPLAACRADFDRLMKHSNGWEDDG